MTLEKTAAGLGFSLEGGRGSLHGDKPLTINRLFKGTLCLCLCFSPAVGRRWLSLSLGNMIFSLVPGAASEHSETVQPGDELLHVAGSAMQGLTRFEAWNVIKALPDGPVAVVIRKTGLQSRGATEAGNA